jgi:hypothetical protein
MRYSSVGEWSIGSPVVYALRGTSDKRAWDRHYYSTDIPIKYKISNDFNTVENAIANGSLRIDSITISFIELDESYTRYAYKNHLGLPRVDDFGGYVSGVLCLSFDTLTIPSDEDSIKVDFTVNILNERDSSVIQTPFSFILYRFESTRLGAWAGK